MSSWPAIDSSASCPSDGLLVGVSVFVLALLIFRVDRLGGDSYSNGLFVMSPVVEALRAVKVLDILRSDADVLRGVEVLAADLLRGV